MLSIRAISSGGQYRAYLEKEAPGRWLGSGAKLLNLPENVTKEDYKSIRFGLHPETQEPLRIRRVVDRIYHKPWGPEIYKARGLYDLTISAPKSVSVMAMVDERISAAHRYAVEQTWREMESRCGAMVIAAYHHQYSRGLDPQEHTHLVAGNLSFDGEKWRTLGANYLYRGQGEITEHYRIHLLGTLEREGYRIRYPELADVPKELIERFSTRSHEREEAVRAFAEHHGREPGTRETAVLVRNHRAEKVHVPAAELRERQFERLNPAERETLLVVAERAQEAERVRVPSLADPVEHESPAERHRWTYGKDRVRPSAYS